MGLYRVLGVITVCAGLTVIARADVVQDPLIAIDQNNDSAALLPGVNFAPSQDGGGTFPYYNPTTMFVTKVDFATGIGPPSQTGLSPTPMSLYTFGPYKCIGSPFFTQCSFSYDSSGVLGIDFKTNNPGGQASILTGIPPLPPGCLGHPDSGNGTNGVPCTSQGHFTIDLNNNNNHNGDTGGWTPGDKIITTQVAVGPNYTPIPEPSLTLLLAVGCALVLGFARRRRSAVSR